MSELKNGNGEEHPNAVSVFIGLGPAASTISDDALRQRLEEVVPVLGVRIRGRCAFADVPDSRAAERLVAELDGKSIGEARMAVQISRTKEKDRPSAFAAGGGGGGGGGRTSIFVGLGPSGGIISDKELRNKLEEVAPVVGFRRRGQCAFVDVAEVGHASRMIQELNNQYMGDCRLSVQYSRDNKRPRYEMGMERHSRTMGSRRRQNNSRGRRSDSPTKRRRRRHRSRSYSSRSSSGRRSSVVSDDSRDYRRRDRRRRDRSRSYSSRSRSSSHSYRRRRD